MGAIVEPAEVLLIVAAFSRHERALDWARGRCVDAWGPVALESPRFSFVQTDYYTPTMGPGLMKRFWAFERKIDPAALPGIKLETNDWELEYAKVGDHAEPRPLNLDPGYLTPAKLVLASTKDHAHRLYLSQGIYAEVTLYYKHHHWRAHDWTFPDYRREDYQEFFDRCRALVLARGSEDTQR